MMQQQETELYPVGTDVIGMYVGRDSSTGYGLFESGYDLNSSGEYVSGSFAKPANDAYIPIDPEYTYTKNGCRLYIIAFYDFQKQFISRITPSPQLYNNLTVKDITDIPQNAKYLRFTAYSTAGSNWKLAITRTA